MVIAVRTERGATGLEVVKVADDDAGRARLAREAEVLRRATHPGVVQVVGLTESTLRLRHGGTPLARLGAIAPDHAAAIVRAIADIVDSMHQQGMVHRRIDAGHVVVNERGRPQLVGFGEAGDGDATEQADDVAALGRLLDHLLDSSTEALWSLAHRGVRAAPRRKRAMAGFRTAAAGAQREAAGQRLTARQFATAISDALPGLSLPTPPGEPPDAPVGDDGDEGDIDPTADLGWSDLDLSMLAVEEDFADAGGDDPGARRDPYARLADLAGPDPEDAPAVGAAPEIDWGDVAREAATGAGEAATGAGEPDDERGTPAALGPGGGAEPGDARDPGDAPVGHAAVDPIVAALRSALDAEGTSWASSPDPDVPPADTTEDTTEDTAEDTAAAGTDHDQPAPAPAQPPTTPARAEPPDDPLTIEIRSGLADAAGPPAEPPPTDRRVLALVAAVLLVVGVVAGALIARAVDPFGADTASAAGDTDTSTDPTATEPTSPEPTTDAAPPPTPPAPPAECEAVALPGPDVDGDGCPEEVGLDGRVATVGEVEIELGQDGDVVSFADTDCDGIVTPVVLRPGTGEVFVFEQWSLDEPVEVSAATTVDDAVDVERGPEPCSPAVVTDGAGNQVEVPGR